MEAASEKRKMWRDNEVVEMLAIMKDERVLNMQGNKTIRNMKIYEYVAKEMRKKGIRKNAAQVGAKFWTLKRQYYKAKRANNPNDPERENCIYFDDLDKICSRRPAVAAEGLDTSKLSEDALSIVEIKDEESECERSSERKTSSAFNKVETSEELSYEKVIKKFTEEWKDTQIRFLKHLEKQQEKYIASIGELLEENRKETRKMMEEDRRETSKMITSLMSSSQTPVHRPMPHIYAQPNSRVDENNSLPSPSDNERRISFSLLW